MSGWWKNPSESRDQVILDATLGEPACKGTKSLVGVKLVPASTTSPNQTPIADLVKMVGPAADERLAIFELFQEEQKPLTKQAEDALDQIDDRIVAAYKKVDVHTGEGPHPAIFSFYRIIGAGSYGTVAEYRVHASAPKMLPLAVKVCW